MKIANTGLTRKFRKGVFSMVSTLQPSETAFKNPVGFTPYLTLEQLRLDTTANYEAKVTQFLNLIGVPSSDKTILLNNSESTDGYVADALPPTMRERLYPIKGDLKLEPGTSGAWDDAQTIESSFFKDPDGKFRIYYTGSSNVGGPSFKNTIMLATAPSPDDVWVKYGTNPVIGMGYGGAPSDRRAHCSCVYRANTGTYYAYATNGYGMNYSGEDRNVYGYTSPDGYAWTDMGLKLDKTSFPNILGFGNTCLATDKSNVPIQVEGKYIMYAEAMTNLNIWEIFRAEATSLDGSWTITQKLTSLKPSGGMYGGACVIYNSGKFHCFLHYGVTSTAPTYLGYLNSTDGINFTVKEAPLITYYDADDTPPIPPALANFPYPHTDQAADGYVGEINGKTYFMAELVQNEPTLIGQLRKWRFDGTFEQFVSGF